MSAPAAGDFSWMKDNMTRTACEDMYEAITKVEAWVAMKEDPGEGGYMFSGAEVVDRVSAVLNDRVGHSGASFGMTMRSMQRLARIGWEAWVAEQRAAQKAKEEKDAMMRACFAAGGIANPHTKCPHGLPSFACMPCSH